LTGGLSYTNINIMYSPIVVLDKTESHILLSTSTVKSCTDKQYVFMENSTLVTRSDDILDFTDISEESCIYLMERSVDIDTSNRIFLEWLNT